MQIFRRFICGEKRECHGDANMMSDIVEAVRVEI